MRRRGKEERKEGKGSVGKLREERERKGNCRTVKRGKEKRTENKVTKGKARKEGK